LRGSAGDSRRSIRFQARRSSQSRTVSPPRPRRTVLEVNLALPLPRPSRHLGRRRRSTPAWDDEQERSLSFCSSKTSSQSRVDSQPLAPRLARLATRRLTRGGSGVGRRPPRAVVALAMANDPQPGGPKPTPSPKPEPIRPSPMSPETRAARTASDNKSRHLVPPELPPLSAWARTWPSRRTSVSSTGVSTSVMRLPLVAVSGSAVCRYREGLA
jgi:hypothetical protein